MAFLHPVDERPIAVTAPVPEDLQQLWRSLSGRELAEFVADRSER